MKYYQMMLTPGRNGKRRSSLNMIRETGHHLPLAGKQAQSDTENYEERVALDTWYVLNRSFWLDMKIIFKTVGCMIKGKGAY
jgi:hypothetical protein